MQLLPAQPGDVEATEANCSDLALDMGYELRVGMEEGVRHFS